MIPGIYRHFKGGLYRVLFTARFRTSDRYKSLEGCNCVVYVSLEDGSLHVRPAYEFAEAVTNPTTGCTAARFKLEHVDP